jgi:hypothetical protein
MGVRDSSRAMYELCSAGRSWIAVLAVVAAAVGCGASRPNANSVQLANVPSWTESPSPLERVVGSMPPAKQIAAQTLIERERQLEVQACMRAYGFEYKVSAPKDDALVDLVSLSERARLSKYGFGVIASALAINVDAVSTGGTNSAERAAYGLTLNGATPTAPDAAVSETGGCIKVADDKVATLPEFVSLAALSEHAAEIADLKARIAGDARVVALWQNWADCMTALGHSDLHRIPDLTKQIADRFGAIQDQFRDQTASTGSDLVSRLTPEGRKRLAELQKYEIDMAITSYNCEANTRVDLIAITRQYEQDFVDKIG